MSNSDPSLLSFSALSETGMLWLINTSVFHPRGLALAVQFDDDGAAIGWKLVAAPTGEAYDYLPVSESVPEGVDIDDAYRRAEAFMESVRHPERVEATPSGDLDLIAPLRSELAQLIADAPADEEQLSGWYTRVTEVMTSIRSLLVRGEPSPRIPIGSPGSESAGQDQDEHDDQQDADDAPDEVVGVRHGGGVPADDDPQPAHAREQDGNMSEGEPRLIGHIHWEVSGSMPVYEVDQWASDITTLHEEMLGQIVIDHGLETVEAEHYNFVPAGRGNLDGGADDVE